MASAAAGTSTALVGLATVEGASRRRVAGDGLPAELAVAAEDPLEDCRGRFARGDPKNLLFHFRRRVSTACSTCCSVVVDCPDEISASRMGARSDAAWGIHVSGTVKALPRWNRLFKQTTQQWG